MFNILLTVGTGPKQLQLIHLRSNGPSYNLLSLLWLTYLVDNPFRAVDRNSKASGT